MTTISFKRSGGFVGKELHLELDLENLPKAEAQYLQKLIDEANFFNLSKNLAMRSKPDEYLYKITVDDGGEGHTVRITDTTVPTSLLPLIKELTLQKVIQR